jgi:hypothetical protein
MYLYNINNLKMRRFIALSLVLVLCISWTNSSDCRIFNFGSTPEQVMDKETALFMKKENLSHNLIGLTFVEHGNVANYLHTYTFHNGKLNGLKSKKLSAVGDNSMINALNDYQSAYTRYKSSNCGVKIKEKIDNELGLKSFSLEITNKKIFVNMIIDSGEYFLVENILQK